MEGTDDFRRYFDAADYTVFGFLLAASLLIGVYFGAWGKKQQNSAAEYLLGNRQMHFIPIAMSLIATHYSGYTLFGYVSEIYINGTQIWAMLFLDVIMTLVMVFWFVPVFYSLKLTSMYEYLNKRFNASVRTIGSILFICKMMVMIPIGVYGPAIAVAQISGVSIEVLIPAACLVCIFYTTIGGFKAVVWADTLQMLFITVGIVIIPIMGTYSAGGVSAVLDIARAGDRLEFSNLSWDPTVRHSLWNVMIGKFVHRVAFFSINQGTTQRCLSTPTLKKAQISVAIFGAGMSILQHFTMYTGLVIYAAFHTCDPITAKIVSKPDQILPLFVMKITSHLPAVPGIFLSAIFGATLSTMSTGLNSMSGVIVEDLMKPVFKTNISESRASLYMKIATIILGAVCIVLTFLVQYLSGLVQGASSLTGITLGSLLGIYCLGMFFPWANATGALVGGVCSAALVSWMAFGSQMAIHKKQVVYQRKPVTLSGCSNATLEFYHNVTTKLLNETTAAPTPVKTSPFILYAISYTWYALIGVVIVLVVGMLVSWMTGFNNPHDMDHRLFSPAIKRFLRKRASPTENNQNGNEPQKFDLMSRGLDLPLLPQNNERFNCQREI